MSLEYLKLQHMWLYLFTIAWLNALMNLTSNTEIILRVDSVPTSFGTPLESFIVWKTVQKKNGFSRPRMRGERGTAWFQPASR